MESDSRFDRLRNLSIAGPVDLDETALPPEAFEALRREGKTFGKFVLLGELGRGGTSVVYRAWQTDLRREVALKVVTGLHPELRERFVREARVGGRLAHPALLVVFETGEADGALWLAMPLVQGKTLDQCGLSAVEAARAVATAASGVHAAHEAGVVHRDLKPNNIMRDGAGAVVVMDFGLALTRDDATRISVTGQVMGTPHYMAPEQARGGVTDARSDVYGLGATLYRLVAGRPPYETATFQEFLRVVAVRDPDPPSRHAKVPADLETIVLKAMDREPARRYPSAAAMADDLERFSRGEPVLGRRVPAAVKAWRWAKRRGSWFAFAGAAAVVVVAATRPAPAPSAPWVPPLPSPQPAKQPAPVAKPEAPYARVLEAAWDLKHRGEVVAALAAYEKVQLEFPLCAGAWSGGGECRMELHQWKAASDDFTRALDLDPNNASYLRERGESRVYDNDIEGADADYARLISLTPNAPDGYLGRSRVHALRGEGDLALKDCNTAVDLGPGNIWIRTARATLKYQLEMYADSIADYDEAVRIGGLQPPLLRARGRAKGKFGDIAGALADIEKAIELDPSLAEQCEEELSELRKTPRE